jgi:Na+/melibiose symporter-like transporter
VGLGFFTVAIVWSLYNVAVPTYLNDIFKGLKANKFLVGCIMTIDNIFAMAFNPLFGKFSDKTHTRFGRRMPYLMVGIPIAAILFLLIPFVKDTLWMLMTVVIAMNFFMCVYRTPTVALMPDLTPPHLRSQANGIINLMGGLGTALAMGVGAALFATSEILPFALGATIMIVTIIIMFFTVKEPKEVYAKDEKKDDENVVLPKSMKRS